MKTPPVKIKVKSKRSDYWLDISFLNLDARQSDKLQSLLMQMGFDVEVDPFRDE